MTRAEKVARAQELRAQGLLVREIAEEMGVAIQSVSAWLNDPDRSKEIARKKTYAGTCEDCGAATTGTASGLDRAPRWCKDCGNRHSSETRTVWTRELVIARIHEWAERYGDAPAFLDWQPWEVRHRVEIGEAPAHALIRAARFEDAGNYWPWGNHVARVFGSWNAAIEAAGFAPRAAHGGGGNEQRHGAYLAEVA